MHKMIDHVPAAKKDGNADQNRNKKRHNVSPSVVAIAGLTLVQGRSSLPYFLAGAAGLAVPPVTSPPLGAPLSPLLVLPEED
jgi:hypothetical protein